MILSRLQIPILCTSSSSFHHHLTTAISHPPLTPLFLRPLSHKTSPSSLLSFLRHAQTLARSSSPNLSPSHLLRELHWLVDDATLRSGDTILLRADIEDLYRLWEERIELRRPFQYIVGCEHWRDLVLAVGEGVLIPRPETEEMVELVRGADGFGEGVWADLGTGCGAIAVGIGREMEGRGRVVGTDLSGVAVEMARFNVGRYGLEVRFLGIVLMDC